MMQSYRHIEVEVVFAVEVRLLVDAHVERQGSDDASLHTPPVEDLSANSRILFMFRRNTRTNLE